MTDGFLTGNLVLDLGILAWLVAQLIKFFLSLIVQRKLDLGLLLSSGGMPSSHSSFVCAITTSIGVLYDWRSPLFALAVGLSAIVMYDACNVRRAAGENTKVINDLLAHLNQLTPERALKEILGHTPLQVAVGALLGVAIGLWGAAL